jgi:TonB family protein
MSRTLFSSVVLVLPTVVCAEWLADPQTGCSFDFQYPVQGERAAWNGPCLDGKAQGIGILVGSGGTRIEGEFRQGKPYEAKGREALLLNNGMRMLVDVTYRAGTSWSRPLTKTAEERAAYAKVLADAVRKNVVLPENIEGNPTAVVSVQVSRAGEIVSYQLSQPSDSSMWDQAVLRALERTGTLPLDFDRTIPSRIEMAFRPR